MKRFRVLQMDFDTRPTILTTEIGADWAPNVQESWRANKASVRARFLAEFGAIDGEAKLANFTDLGAAPFSVVAFHNRFYSEVRRAFIVGAYYPALVGTCALGERVLNHLVLKLRDSYQHTPEFQDVAGKKSFTNWKVMTDTLAAWGAILPQTADLFGELRHVRHRSIHFNPETDLGCRDAALVALRLFHKIIDRQFTAFGDRPWFIPNDVGISFVKKSEEAVPFVVHMVLPSCSLVGPGHGLEHDRFGNWMAVERADDPIADVTDEEFIAQFKTRQR